jgi:RNA polymerase sigma-70 factor (ECF subfamily)
VDSSATASQPPPPARSPATPEAAASDFGSFYSATIEPLRRHLSRILRSRDDAQDIAHDAYIRTYKAMDHSSIEKPQAFLFTIARRLAINYRTRRADRMQVTEHSILEAQPDPNPSSAALLSEQESSVPLQSAILKLPPVCQQIFLLRTKRGMAYEDIARKLGITRSTVANHLSRAYRILREYVEHEGNDSGPPSFD